MKVRLVRRMQEKRIALFRNDFTETKDFEDILYRLGIPKDKWNEILVLELWVSEFDYR